MYDLNFAVHKLHRQSIVIPRKMLVITIFRLIHIDQIIYEGSRLICDSYVWI